MTFDYIEVIRLAGSYENTISTFSKNRGKRRMQKQACKSLENQ